MWDEDHSSAEEQWKLSKLSSKWVIATEPNHLNDPFIERITVTLLKSQFLGIIFVEIHKNRQYSVLIASLIELL